MSLQMMPFMFSALQKNLWAAFGTGRVLSNMVLVATLKILLLSILSGRALVMLPPAHPDQ